MSKDAPLAAADGNLTALAQLAFRGSRRTAKAASLVAAGQLAWTTGRRARDLWRNHREYTVAVESTDPVYDDVHRWLAGAIDPAARRMVTVATGGGTSGELASDDGRREARRVVVRFNGQARQTVRIDGHQVQVSVDTDDHPSSGSGDKVRRTVERVQFTCPGQAARDAVIDLLARMITSGADDAARVYFANRWGGWQRLNPGPPRPLDSVVLAAGQLERIVDDLAQFLDGESAYVRMGVPWHRGYLLHGPPGTGKTSTARAIASRFGMDLYMLSLSDVEDDGSLSNLVANLNGRAMLLIEDCDVSSVSHDRADSDSDRPGATLAGLLNVLDGAATPHGLVTVLTSNRADVLDPALLRPGRCDLIEHLDLLPPDRAEMLFHRMTGTSLPSGVLPDRVNPADIAQAVLRHLHDPHAAAARLHGIREAARAG